MDLLKRLRGDSEPPPLVPDDVLDFQARVDAELATIEPYAPVADLQPFKPSGRCPKCRSGAVTIDYRSGAHAGCPDLRMNDYPYWITSLSAPSPRMMALDVRKREQAVEHHDRTCVNCKFAWVEDVAR